MGSFSGSEDVAPAKLFAHEKAIIRYRAEANGRRINDARIKNEVESDYLTIE